MNALTRWPFPLYVIIITWLIFCLYCKPAEVSMSAGGCRQTECRLPTCPVSVTDMSSVGYRHDTCRRPLPIIGSAVGGIFWKLRLLPVYKHAVFLQLRTSRLESALYTLCYTHNKDCYTHTQFTLSLVVSSIPRSYVPYLIPF